MSYLGLNYYCEVSRVESIALQSVAFQHGWQWTNKKTEIADTDSKYLYFKLSDKSLMQSTKPNESDQSPYREEGLEKRSFEEIIDIIVEPPINIGSYVVEFHRNGSVTVGCQTVDNDTLNKIVRKANENL